MKKQEKVRIGFIDSTLIRGLLFDIDGTLSDSDDHMVDRVCKVLAPICWLFRNKNPKHFARWLVMAVETPANFLYMLADRVGLDAMFARLYNWMAHRRKKKTADDSHYKMIPGVREMLETLAEHYPMAVVSARDALTTRHFLEYFDLLPFFTMVVTSQTCKFTKPYPDPLLYAAEVLGVPAEACLMIGDTVVDVRAGKAAGAQTAAVLCGFGQKSELIRAGADLVLTATPEIVDSLLKRDRPSA
jgi:HAD superfamily hydrolase (TIGR01549 family)